MSLYVSLVKFTPEGLATMKEKGVDRSEMVKRNVESSGGKLLHTYYCLGEYDAVAILDFPNNRSAIQSALLNASMGHIRITTMPAVSRDEWREILQEMGEKAQ